jgi:hypothetical protein
MAKQRNTAIGEVECSHKGCEHKASIFKFRAQTRNPADWARRYAGKLYSRCEAGHECKDQDYLLSKGKLWGPGEAKAAEAADPVKAESKDQAPAQQTPQERQPGPTAKSTPASRDAGRPAASSQASSRATFGFWNFRSKKA